MKTLFLMSLLFATVAVPIWAARDPIPRRGVRRLGLFFALFIAAYILYLAKLHHVLFVPER